MKNLELIIIEDNPACHTFYTKVLKGTGCQTSFCSTAGLVMSLASLIPPEVVIVDLGLPDGDGVDAIRAIRNGIQGVQPYIIVATGSEDESEHQRAMQAGADKLLIKPIDIKLLRAILDRLSLESK